MNAFEKLKENHSKQKIAKKSEVRSGREKTPFRGVK